MSYREGITVNGKHSFVDFGLNISSRLIGLPPKNNIRKTIPYMSGFYDFTTLNGVATFGERPISYTFDVIGATVEEMDRKRTEVVNWFCNMHDVEIYDDTFPDYHFYGSYDSVSQNEDGEKTELTITFVCYPFMIANEPVQMLYNEARTDTVMYEGQPVSIYGKGNAILKMGGSIITLNSAEKVDTGLVLTAGEQVIEVTPTELLTYPYIDKTKTMSGITFTDNGDGTITANGTATEQVSFEIAAFSKQENRTFYIKGCPNGGTSMSYTLLVSYYDAAGKWESERYELGNAIIIDGHADFRVRILIRSGVTVENLVFRPSMIQATMLEYVEEVL